MSQIFNIEDDKVVINKLKVAQIEGTVNHTGQLIVAGAVDVNNNLTVTGVLRASKIVTDNGSYAEPGVYRSMEDAGIQNTGMFWHTDAKSYKLVYQANGTIFADTSVNLAKDKEYKINNSLVINTTTIGDTVTNSNLTKVGELLTLDVRGDVKLSSFVEVNAASKTLTVTGLLKVKGIEAETIKAKNILTEDGSTLEFGKFKGAVDADVVNKGLSWHIDSLNYKLAYQAGGNIFTDANFNIPKDKSYRVNNIPVILADRLGDSIVSSNLRRLGNLTSLTVNGNANISQFAFFTDSRLGLGTDVPNALLSLAENDVELVFGAPTLGKGKIGTHTSHDLSLVTDNTDRIILKSNGEVHIGNESTRNGILRVFGELHADKVVSDTRLTRSTPLEFAETPDNPVYGMGLLWSSPRGPKQFMLMNGPDRIWSTESIDLAKTKVFSINKQTVITETALGDSVVESKLTTLGALKTLSVQGASEFSGELNANKILSSSIAVKDDVNTLTFTPTGVNPTSSFNVGFYGFNRLQITKDTFGIGNKLDPAKIINVYGKLSVGVNNPDADVDLTVKGPARIDGKKFITGSEVPTQGSFQVGDICWNTKPQVHSYVGWVCVVTGTPGQWEPFGGIGRQ
jgi:hypothetical protein